MRTELLEEQEWVKERIKNVLSKPYFFKEDKLVVAKEDLATLYKQLKDRIWIDRHRQIRLWYLKIEFYRNEEEYVWMRIL